MPLVSEFVQCPLTKIVKENGGTVLKQCIHDSGAGHVGPCVWFKWIKKKW